MITLEDNARTELDAYFKEHDASPIRIYLGQGGCSGPALHLALDEKHDDDEVVEVGDYTFVVETGLFEAAKPLTITMSAMGFQVSSNLQIEAPKGGCGSCSCCG